MTERNGNSRAQFFVRLVETFSAHVHHEKLCTVSCTLNEPSYMSNYYPLVKLFENIQVFNPFLFRVTN